MDATYIEEFLWSAVQPRGVEDQFTFEVEDACHHFGQLANGQILACTYVDQRRFVLRDQGFVRVVRQIQEMNAGFGKIVAIQEFAARSTRAPYDQLLLASTLC